jgi:hypothetical protein
MHRTNVSSTSRGRRNPQGRDISRWQVGLEHCEDSLNGNKEAILELPGSHEDAVKHFNETPAVPYLPRAGKMSGASTLIKRLWPTTWLQAQHGFSSPDFAMPDTRQIAEDKPFASALPEHEPTSSRTTSRICSRARDRVAGIQRLVDRPPQIPSAC